MVGLSLLGAEDAGATVTVSPWLTALVAIVLVGLAVAIFLLLRSIDRRDE